MLHIYFIKIHTPKRSDGIRRKPHFIQQTENIDVFWMKTVFFDVLIQKDSV